MELPGAVPADSHVRASRRPTHFDAAACFAIRTGAGPSPAYAIRCLSGPDFSLTGQPGNPIRSGQANAASR
jgi:hypothetical protein